MEGKKDDASVDNTEQSGTSPLPVKISGSMDNPPEYNWQVQHMMRWIKCHKCNGVGTDGWDDCEPCGGLGVILVNDVMLH